MMQSSVALSAVKKPTTLSGTTQTLKVYPAEIIDSEWGGYESVLSADLSDNALFQDFTQSNSAYVTTESVVFPPPLPVAATPAVDTPSDNPALEGDDEETSTTDTATPAPDEAASTVTDEAVETQFDPEPEEPIDAPVTDETPEAAVSQRGTGGRFQTLLASVSGLFLFTQATTDIDSSVNGEPDAPTSEGVPVPEEVVTSDMIDAVETATLPVTEEPTLTDEVVPPAEQGTEPSTAIPATTSTPVATSTEAVTVVPEEVVSETVVPIETKTIKLGDFSTAPLGRGESIKNIQLRASLAGRYFPHASGTLPFVEFVATTPEHGSVSLGSVILDGEVSNALNGGSFLFAFPTQQSLEFLSDTSVSVVFHGNPDDVDGVYLDAVWLEVEIETLTKDDLMKRLEQEVLHRLALPQTSELLSLKRDFAKSEDPVFNLKYDSQRSRALAAVRNFLGQTMVKVERAAVVHHGSGEIGIIPDVTVTKDGLITVAIPDTERSKMKPGEYAIELTLNEGGKFFIDSFDFQWGLLSINTHQTQYESGDTAHVYAGALSPNGNTICDADLRLYVIDPRGLISQTTVDPSGQCFGNNVIDVPDYATDVVLADVGTYELYLERVDENGDVISHTSMTAEVVSSNQLYIERAGPTRIFPPAVYPMTLTVHADTSFSGTLTERVPVDFTVTAPSASVRVVNGYKEIVWDLDVMAGSSKTVSYDFDAPDLSPFLYELGPAELHQARSGGVRAPRVQSTTTLSNASVSTSSVATSSVAATPAAASSDFIEHRTWQIASDATGNMIMLWDDGASIPTGWSCISCAGGDVFFQQFAMGSTTYNGTGGATTHTHTASASVLASSAAATESNGSGAIDAVSHSHTLTPTIATASNLPLYRNLRYIQYTAGAGEPTDIPTGAIGIFDAAVPSGWTQYSAQDGYYIRGESTPGTTGGSNTHTHAISGTLGAGSGTTYGSRGGLPQGTGATAGHTHTVSGATAADSTEPPYITVILGKLNATTTPPNGLITMWTDTVPGGWLDESTGVSDPFYGRFMKASTTYGVTGGGTTHTPANVTGLTTSVPNSTTNSRQGVFGASGSHTHSVSVTSFAGSNHLPPHKSVLVGKRQGTDPVYRQLSYAWYQNANSTTPGSAWPPGLGEGEPISATSTTVKDSAIVRLRLSTLVTNATSTAGTAFKLQYGTSTLCSAVSTWYDVGDTASSTQWRGYNNTTPSDGSTLGSTLLASSTVLETYEEDGLATSTPNEIGVGAVGEWDFVLQNNNADAGTNFCFRMVADDGTPFGTYSMYPALLTDQSPDAPSHLVPFDNEKTASTTLSFDFVTSDPESQDMHYQIQIDNDYDFSSTLEDKDSVSFSTSFTNLVVPSDKAPFTSGQRIQFVSASTFTNGVTYWWRVRAKDPSGSNDWGTWSDPESLTIDTSLTATGWFQTMQEQFDKNTLVGTETLGSDAVDLITGSTTGTMTSSGIDFDDATEGTAWDSLVFSDTETSGDVKYQVQYFTSTSSWANVPDTDLSGNSTGFDTSPVSLLTLDTDTYNMLRIVATLTNSGGSPSIQDWGINWGYRVETPTILAPFANEKVGTTTPFFKFYTSDPQSDSLTYQIQWSTDETFAASTTRTSDTDAGFSNITTGADTDPFISGDTIQFELQGADALTNNTTYWWRVRAKDTTGSDAYSFWTTPQSFTIDTTVTVSTWFQTTLEQFDTNVLSGTLAVTPGDVAVATTAREAILVYGEGTATTPQYRTWNGTVWTSAADTLDIGAPVKWVRTEAGTTREEYVSVTVGTDNDVNAQVYSTGAWGHLQEVTTSMGNINARGFDVAYETLSGDAMVAYCDGDADPSYYIWNGTSWTSGGTINLASANNCEWLQLASDPTTDEIILLSRDSTGSQYEAQVWNGSGWGNSTTLGTVVDVEDAGMAVEYEESGNQAIIVTSDGNPARFRYSTWDGTNWSAAGTQGLGDDLEWGRLVRDKGSDELLLCYQDEDTNIGYVHWDGSAWTGQGELLTTTGKSKTNPGFSCAYEDGGSRDNYAMIVYTDTTQENYSFWNNTTWSTPAQINTMGDTVTSVLERTGVGTLLGLFFDETNDALLFSSWNGSSWSTTQTIESDASVDTTPYGRPYDIGVRNPGTRGTVVVSPAINFTDGSGPYWQQFSWNDTTPGTSDIRYSLQYYNGSSWQFIPDGALSGNSTGFTNSPVDLTGLNKTTYGTIRPYALLTCDGSSNCPTLHDWTVTWAAGITISGTLRAYDESTNINSGTVAVAVNGVRQTGKTATVSAGTWSISNVTVEAGDVVTVFVDGAAESSEAVGVTRYTGVGNITGLDLYERHLALGSDLATTTPLSNADIGLYDGTDDEDLPLSLSGTTLNACTTAGCDDIVLIVNASTTYTPGGTVLTHDVRNNGTISSTATWYVSGSWDNNATTTLTGSTVVMTATSTTESIDTTGAAIGSFGNLTFGTTTGAATWTLANALDVNGNLTVTRGTLSRGSELVTVTGNLATAANGFWTGLATTTFDGSTSAIWSDANVTKQNIGYVVIDGTTKIVTLGGNVLAQSVTIGADDTLDASSTYTLTTYEDFVNNNNFQARSGTVYMAATTSGHLITAGSDAFYNLAFTGSGGGWSFTEANLTINNDLTISAGTVTMPTATTSIAGSFSNTGGTFVHNNAEIRFTSTGAETLTLAGTAFTNSFYDVRFTGSGTYTFTETNATTTNDFYISAGTVVFPTATLALGGSLYQTGGTITAGTNTLVLTSGVAESLTVTSSLGSVLVSAAGSFAFTNSTATLTGDLTVNAGTLTLPATTLTIGGSIDNNATVNPQTGAVILNASTAGKTIALGSSSLYDLTFNGTGGWTITEPATTTHNTTLTAGTFTLASGQTLAIGGTFTNTLGGANTTWTGSTLNLYGGTYAVNSKTDAGDLYDNTVLIGGTTHVTWWNSSASSVSVTSGGSLYSADNAAVDGALYLYGSYSRTSGTEHWSYATDFDGTSLSGGSERAVLVRFADAATASFSGSTLSIIGTALATTTIENQGSGTYNLAVTNGTMIGSHYAFADLGQTGLSLLGTTAVTTLDDGAFTVGTTTGTGLTIASTTIDANNGLQIFRTYFAGIGSSYNVSQTDGVPTSYWWFRNGTGPRYGESFDNDTGDPGSIRFDDSSLVITVSGTVYSDAGVTPLVGGVCDGSTPVVRVVVDGTTGYTGSCSNVDGTFSIGGVVVIGDPVLTVYLDTAGTTLATMVTKTPTADITDADLYQNRVIVRHEDVSAMTIEDMAVFDTSDDSDISFIAATTTGTDNLTTFSNTELYVWASSTFTPGGAVTLEANATANSYDGSLYLAPAATFTATATSTYTIGGSLTQGAGAVFMPASSTVIMNASTTGKTLTAAVGETIQFNELTFTGVGGGWNVNGDIESASDVYIATGTVTGTGDITVVNGSLYGDGLLSLGGGTVTIERTNTLGGLQGWTFNDLVLGNGSVVGTTTPASTATTTVGGALTIANAHFFDIGGGSLDLAGSGTVFTETGTFLEGTSHVRYSGSGANVISTAYYDLEIAADAGSPTFTGTGLGIQVLHDLSLAGSGAVTLNLNTNDPALSIGNDLYIGPSATLAASNLAVLTLAGSWNNTGTFTANGGTVTVSGTGTETIAPGASSFATLNLTATGAYTITGNATATAALTISDLTSFTQQSGTTLAVGGTFHNYLGGAATTWSGSTLYLYGSGSQLINPATTTESYDTLHIGTNAHIRTWNTSATTVTTDANGSLYSMDHGDVTGDLYIYGDYSKTSGSDFWSYTTDFDGTALGGGSRQVAVAIENGGTISYAGTAQLAVEGAAGATTTISNQGAGTFALSIGGTASTTFSRYAFSDLTAAGLQFSSTAKVGTLSYGTFTVGVNGGTAITVAGTVINANPAKTFTDNTFATSTGIGAATNVTATGASVSSWRFTNHLGSIDGEAYDSDPDGDPGYIVWDDSAAAITITGYVYSDEGLTVSGVCDNSTNVVTVRVAGLTSYQSSCNSGTGQYQVTGVSYSPGDSVIAYLDGTATNGAAVTVDPVSNINDLNIYENRVIVRHEGSDPMTIADMATWDSSDDADIPFTAVTGSPNTLTLPADRKLIVWTSKQFAPGGNVTLTNGGSQSYGGSLQLFSGATWTAAGTQALSVGGSLTSDSGATFTPANGTVTFTTGGAARTVDINNGSFNNVTFSGTGSWTVTDTTLDVNTYTQSAGTVTLPTGTSTVSGSWNVSGGSFVYGGPMLFDGTGANTITFGGSTVGPLYFTGSGSWSMNDANATSTGGVTKTAGSLTLPSGTLALAGSFDNQAGAITHNTSLIAISTSTTAFVRASSSDLYGLTLAGGGTFTLVDASLSLLDDLTLLSGTLTLPTSTLSIGGSFDAIGGTFAHATGTVLFNSTDAGETIAPGSSDFYNVNFGSASGGWTIVGNATTTNNFTLTTASAFTQQSGTILTVNGVFTNLVGGGATTWTGSTLVLDSGSIYELNTKSAGGDVYNVLMLGANTDISAWNSSATTYTVDASASFYSQDHNAVDGSLYIFGDYHIGTTTEYWSYATDFDGTALGGGSRDVTVAIAANATTTVDGGTLNIVGTSGHETTVTNQGSGTYSFAVSAGTLNAQYYKFRNLDTTGVNLSGTPTITSLNYGDYELAVNGGTLISLAATALNANASLVITGNRFATTTAISGYNVTLSGTTPSAWTYTSHTGNLDGEAYDVDGATACGSVRWSDSSCLLTQQTHYQWRNDDGGLEVPSSEWYDGSWSKRQRVRFDNADSTTYTDAVIQLTVPYDSDMKADFSDLRFTDSTGTTTTPFWVEDYTASTEATIWVQVPTIAADGFGTVFMYYGNGSANSSSTLTNTFEAADDFEDGNITEYSGDTSLFVVDGTFAYSGSFGLDNTGNESAAATDGIARFDQSFNNTGGVTLSYYQYVNGPDSGDEPCTLFAVQSPVTGNQNYAVCLEQYSGDRVSIAKNISNTDSSGTLLASTSVTFADNTWYHVEVDWDDDGTIAVTVYNGTSTFATVSTNDTTYTSGGYGFTYWYNYGGWDNLLVRPLVVTEPTVYFGLEQQSGGATWASEFDTAISNLVPGDTTRLRLMVENSGLTVSNQQYQLEYAELAAAPSCEAVSSGSYTAVPVDASCGTSPVCMATSTNYADGDSTIDLLEEANGQFIAGEATEDPANTADPLTIGQNEYTELEYTINLTMNVVDQNMCFRVTNQGSTLDTYLKVARLSLKFDPVVTNVTLNDGQAISLLPGTTTAVYATGTVTDLNGIADLQAATSTIYRSGVAGGAACTPDNNSCYVSQCSFTNCTGNSCEVVCRADVFFHADATDDLPYEGENWLAAIEVSDQSDAIDIGSVASGVELQSLYALDTSSVIDYGSLAVGASTTAATNASTTLYNLGNRSMNINVLGTDLSDGYSSTIPVASQKLATTTFSYSACITCTTLGTTSALVDVDLTKPTVDAPFVEDVVYWGIAIPFGVSSAPHTGTNTFIMISD